MATDIIPAKSGGEADVNMDLSTEKPEIPEGAETKQPELVGGNQLSEQMGDSSGQDIDLIETIISKLEDIEKRLSELEYSENQEMGNEDSEALDNQGKQGFDEPENKGMTQRVEQIEADDIDKEKPDVKDGGENKLVTTEQMEDDEEKNKVDSEKKKELLKRAKSLFESKTKKESVERKTQVTKSNTQKISNESVSKSILGQYLKEVIGR